MKVLLSFRKSPFRLKSEFARSGVPTIPTYCAGRYVVVTSSHNIEAAQILQNMNAKKSRMTIRRQMKINYMFVAERYDTKKS